MDEKSVLLQPARQFIGDLLLRTDTQKLEPLSYKNLAGFCRTLRQKGGGWSAGLVSFLGDADRAVPVGQERSDSEDSYDKM